MSSSNSDFETAGEAKTSPPLTIFQVMTIFTFCFEAAVNEFPLCPLILEDTHIVPSSSIEGMPADVEVWQYARDRTVDPIPFQDHDTSYFSPAVLAVHRALRKLDLCDTFCALLDEALSAKLQEYQLGTVRWTLFYPIANTAYAELNADQPLPTSHLQLDNLQPSSHSVFEITTTDGEVLMFDGTPEQFGWNDQAWHIPKSDLEAGCVDQESGFRYLDQKEKEDTWESICKYEAEYWEEVASRMNELFEELDWEGLGRLQDNDMRSQVSMQARRKFEGMGGF
ncbi:hypothetical protein N0V94_006716 [Neodidymelliopsis sp. IMI 364377]|nr:hypothetical protein N0V94_006716 [Neodidymelliopsis sp. IMI 364377]